MIDLHIHTSYSDGSDTVINILKKAEQAKIEIMSITDHDKVDAYFELRCINISEYYTGKIITGAELRSLYRGRAIEILGYGIDIQRIKDSKYVVNQAGNSKQEEYLENMKKLGKSIGLKFNENIYIGGKNVFASSTFGKEIFKHDENVEIIRKYNLGDDANSFYRNGQTNPSSIFYIDESKDIPSPQVIIDEIHEAGGIAFLAHPFLYLFEDRLQTIEDFINEYDIDGLECYYPLFNDQQTKDLLDLCSKYNIYVSGGSDYHGLSKPDISLGTGKGDLNVPKDLIDKWMKSQDIKN